jgi:polyphosphate glucokinase
MNILGIDIGGTGIKGAPVDLESGKLLHERQRIETPKPATPDAVAAVVKTIVDHFGGGDRVGITFPGVVKNGVTRSAANVDKGWVNFDATKFFVKKLGVPVMVANDADAAGMAEVHFGAGRGIDGVILVVTLGTGIGSALFLNRELVPNTELGHLEIRGKDAEKRASERVREQKELSWKRWGANVGEYLGRLDALFSPDLFIIGGGVCKKADKFFPFLKKFTTVPVVPAQLQNDAGIVGAGLLAQHIAG